MKAREAQKPHNCTRSVAEPASPFDQKACDFDHRELKDPPGEPDLAQIPALSPLRDLRERIVQILKEAINQRVEAAASAAIAISDIVWWGDRSAMVLDPFARCNVCNNMPTVENGQPLILYNRNTYIICCVCECLLGQAE
jgi:hypothetical protein